MPCLRRLHCFVLIFALLLCVPTAVFGQDVVSKAKTLYASAEYEEALQLLESLKGKPANTEASAYQVFCLVALGRRDEARGIVEKIVQTDPMFRPSESDAAPRIRAFFDDIRKPLLPDVARQSYAQGKSAFDTKDWAAAVTSFDRVIAILGETGGADQAAADLKTLASGFRDLARAAAAPPPPKPAPTPTATPTPAPEPPATPQSSARIEPAIYGPAYADVKPPQPAARTMPVWRPALGEDAKVFEGDLELVISEEGKVLEASLTKGVHPRYDAALLEAAKGWTFEPARRNGAAVKYRYVMTIRLTK